MMKKGAALFIILLIIVTLGLVSLMTARSVISNIAVTTSLADSMIAEQASKAGLEYGLLQYQKMNITSLSETIYLDDAKKIKAEITISGNVIESTGYFGRAVKKHSLEEKLN